jgi:L-2-hydroxyglutarate oxidase LhgO
MVATDFLVIGGGVIGLSVARELKRRHADASVTVIEKESNCGAHASGRNSGVLHAGFYYTADSLKARFCRDGNRLLTEYCEDRGIHINKCGKLVVARNEAEDRVLDELLLRGQRNGVPLQEVNTEETKEIEPRAITLRRAIFSPTTASVDPSAVMRRLEKDAKAEGIAIEYSVQYINNRNEGIETNKGKYKAGYVVNAAGLYADKVAQDYGFSQHYKILPFKGLYLKSSEPAGALRTNIYPVPDLRNPFLGVHFTVSEDGGIKIGPTAIPAFWREQYNGVSNFRLEEFLDISYRITSLFLASDMDFKRLSVEEIHKHSRHHMVDLASSLATGVDYASYKRWGKPGIRAQLVDMRKRKLEMDFVMEGDDRSMHILNAVSPAFTSAIPFSRYVCDEIGKQMQ